MTVQPIGLGPSTSEYTEQVAGLAWPAPELAGRETTDFHGKRAVAGLVRTAQDAGWTVKVTEARGSWPSVGQKPSQQRWSLAVRMWRGADRAVAVYVEKASTWQWDTIRYWRLEQFPAELAIGELLERL